MKTVFIFLINGYQKYISPLSAPRCKYYPSCSLYTELAITEFGFWGLLMSVVRFFKCNPFSHGGVDYPSTWAAFKIKERQSI